MKYVVVLALLCLALSDRARAAEPATLVVDASQVSRGLMFVHEVVAASPGERTLVYPKWIPGEHGPTGPLHDLAALRISSNGTVLDWRRDDVDLYAFHFTVPPGATQIAIDFDVLMNAPGDVMSTQSVAVLNWNRVLLYPEGTNSREYFFQPSILLPEGWEYGTALRDPQRSGSRVNFAKTSLEMLVDSPLDMGRFVKKWNLWKDGSAFVQLDAFADAPSDLEIPDNMLKAYERVPAQAFAMYGSRHFADYHALLSLSDDIPFEGIEHHQSGDDRADQGFLTDPDDALSEGDLVTHEFSHSWNGKYRRPADLTTPNFQVPMRTDLLWVYEGMNQYLGDLLTFRAGIRDPKTFPEFIAQQWASMDTETGRATTPIIDVTTGAPYYYLASGQYGAIRRTAYDFYVEGELVWLDVDTIIRTQTNGARSLDTFLHRYSEPALTSPMVVTYTRSDIEHLLNDVAPYDWHAFFDEHIYARAVHPPDDDLKRSGWRFVYTDKTNAYVKASNGHSFVGWYSFGANLSSKGRVGDVRDGSAAWKAGLAPGQQIVAVNGQGYSSDVLVEALTAAQHTTGPISLIVSQTNWFRTIALDYHGGLKYPHLERISGAPDLLTPIASPRALESR